MLNVTVEYLERSESEVEETWRTVARLLVRAEKRNAVGAAGNPAPEAAQNHTVSSMPAQKPAPPEKVAS